jgi:U3 small nucleolar RNA-associated protein 23
MEMRLIPGVPMVYIRRAVMIMEPPSPASTDRRDTIELDKLGGRETLKRKRGEEEGKVRKKKGPKEPNPLSIKKKKKSVKENARKGGEDTNDGDVKDLVITESNIIGDVTDSVRRSKSTRRRRHHKPNPQQTDATTREDVVKA